jgi:hypothetical protein
VLLDALEQLDNADVPLETLLLAGTALPSGAEDAFGLWKVNPARSTAVAIFQGGWAVEQLWLFWVAPLIGGGLAGLVQRWLAPK